MNRSVHRRRGSAAVELVVVVPFALVLMAAIVDLRAFSMHRADVDRELYTVAEMVAGAGRWDATTAPNALRKVMRAAADRLRGCPVEDAGRCGHTAGWLRVAVVARARDDPGDASATPPRPAVAATNSEGNLCNPTTGTPPFCEPVMLFEVDFDAATAGVQRAEWGGDQSEGNLCADALTGLPTNIGDQFGANAVVLPNEDADPDGAGPATPPAASNWTSRNLDADEWWAVVEVCTHFAGGTSAPDLFQGGMAGLAIEALDLSGSGAYPRRVAWGSLDSVVSCTWCGASS